ncbi:hypothetical protein AAFF_G00152680 [Aldrovandia affinis]|uniref:Rho-GAP domain-containing protein n=1 Tax=Aldrovandia affinis TaxID=143900 RepID=A0AAD7RNW5_9TELE|nr:hypothetical protein AAFF_G00152680 [Aldrovandia affinis]
MTFELYNDWFKAAGEKEVPDKLEQLKGVIVKLPPENYTNLRYLVLFLARLCEHQDVNKMSPRNIAIVLGPNLLWPRTEGVDPPLDMASASSVQVVMVIEPLIQHANSLFPGAVDFGIPEPQEGTDQTAPLSPLSESGSEEGTAVTGLCSSPPSHSNSSSSSKERSDPVIVKSGSLIHRTTVWENPTSDPTSQNHTQNQNQNPTSKLTQTQQSLPPKPTLDQECKAKRSFQQHKTTLTQAKEPQPRNCPIAKPRASCPPLIQVTAPKTQPRLAMKPQASPNNNAKPKSATLGEIQVMITC